MRSGPSGPQPLLRMTHLSLPGCSYHSLSWSLSPSFRLHLSSCPPPPPPQEYFCLLLFRLRRAPHCTSYQPVLASVCQVIFILSLMI